jgi:hypothetical protein
VHNAPGNAAYQFKLEKKGVKPVRRKAKDPKNRPATKLRNKSELVEEVDREELYLTPDKMRENPYKTPPNELTSKEQPR